MASARRPKQVLESRLVCVARKTVGVAKNMKFEHFSTNLELEELQKVFVAGAVVRVESSGEPNTHVFLSCVKKYHHLHSTAINCRAVS